MCVIIVMKDKLISKENLKKCEDANKDGGGVSWVEDGIVHWKKGIDSNEIWDIINKVELPIVAHFRIGTVGGNIKGLTHPFPITKDCSIALEGTADKVLHHNGHWNSWESSCMQMVMFHKLYFPLGAWSDSRALAWIVYHTNQSILRFTGGKVAIHSAKAIHTYGAWDEIEGVYYSNDAWVRKYAGFGQGCDWQSYGGYAHSEHYNPNRWTGGEKKAKGVRESKNDPYALLREELSEAELAVMDYECGGDLQLEDIWIQQNHDIKNKGNK